jgi:SAM-dependent methyltransferase
MPPPLWLAENDTARVFLFGVAGYDTALGAVAEQVIEPLLDSVQVAPNQSLLDVACGAGHVAAAAAARGANVVGVDFAFAMVNEARRNHPGLRFEQADAEDLPFEDKSFDAVVVSFGMLHFARPDKALAEFHRVLVPGGRLAFTVWAAPDESDAFRILTGNIAAHADATTPLPPGPSFFQFADQQVAGDALAAAGFIDQALKRIPIVWRAASSDQLLDSVLSATVRTGAIVQAQKPEVQEVIRSSLRGALAEYNRGSGIELPTPALLYSARKP